MFLNKWWTLKRKDKKNDVTMKGNNTKTNYNWMSVNIDNGSVEHFVIDSGLTIEVDIVIIYQET